MDRTAELEAEVTRLQVENERLTCMIELTNGMMTELLSQDAVIKAEAIGVLALVDQLMSTIMPTFETEYASQLVH